MNKMLKQVQKIQEESQRLQERLHEFTVSASAGGGSVTVTANGRLEVTKIEIQPEAIDPSDPELLADLVTVAVNEALRKVQELVSQEMQKITGGLRMPGLPGLM